MALYDPGEEPPPRQIRLPATAYLTESFAISRDEASRLCISSQIVNGAIIHFPIYRVGTARHVALFSDVNGQRVDCSLRDGLSVYPGCIVQVSISSDLE